MVYIETIKSGYNNGINQGDVLREIPTFTIKYKDFYSIKNLYVMMHELLLEEGWHGVENQDSDQAAHSEIETLYSENVFQKAIHSGGKEMWIWWRAQKHHEGRRSDYFLNTLDMDWHAVYMEDREIIHQGKKMKTQWGEIEIFFRGRIISDLGHKWEHNKLMKHFKYIYEERIMHAHIEKREKDLWRDLYRLQSKVKSYLKLRTWMPTPELFHAAQYCWEAPEQI